MESVSLYFGLGSPYAYLAIARADAVFGCAPDLQPVLLGAIFKLRGWGSWSQTAQRVTTGPPRISGRGSHARAT